MAKAEQADDQVAGYCQACGGYGRGRFVEVINSHSDAIDRCRACSELPPPPKTPPPAYRRRGRR